MICTCTPIDGSYDSRGCPTHGPDAARYFVDHDTIHDRVTGKHVSIDEAVSMLNVEPDATTRIAWGTVTELGSMLQRMERERDEARQAFVTLAEGRDAIKALADTLAAQGHEAIRQRDEARREVDRLHRAQAVIDGVHRIPHDAIDGFIERCEGHLDMKAENGTENVDSNLLVDAIVNLRQVRAEQRVTLAEVERMRPVVEVARLYLAVRDEPAASSDDVDHDFKAGREESQEQAMRDALTAAESEVAGRCPSNECQIRKTCTGHANCTGQYERTAESEVAW